MNFKFSKHVPNNEADVTGVILKAAADPKVISFAGGLPAPELFPAQELKKASDEVFDNESEVALQYSSAIGFGKLREQINEKLLKPRQIETTVDNISVTTGSEQSIELIAKMFINEGDTVIVEKPTYLCTLDVFKSYGANIVGVDMDEQGMKMDALEETLKAHPEAKLIYTIPTFQNPTGRTMSIERRKAFVELANKYDITVAEDDPYGAIRYAGEELPPLKHFDTEGRVIYLSTFSKILTPGLRLGWIVADKEFVKNFLVMKQMSDLHSDNLTQHIIARYLEENDINQHVAKISALYKHRFELMLKMIETKLPSNIHHSTPEGGMFIWLEIPGEVNTMKLFDACLKNNVAFVPGEAFYAGQGQSGTMRLNFSNVDDDTIKVGMERLGKSLNEFLK